MGNTTKPRRKYRPRPVTADTLQLAMRRARKIPDEEIAHVMAPVKAGFQALRAGVATEADWTVLAGTVELALAIEHQGVVRGLQGHLRTAEAALAAIKARAATAQGWRPTPLFWHEIEAIDTVIWLHTEQLGSLSEGEWRKAHDRATALVLSAGGRAVDINHLQADQAQLQLLGDRK